MRTLEFIKRFRSRLLLRSRAEISRFHEALTPVLRLEEEIIWYSIAGGETPRSRLDDALSRAVVAVAREKREGMAMWAARALSELPEPAAGSDFLLAARTAAEKPARRSVPLILLAVRSHLAQAEPERRASAPAVVDLLILYLSRVRDPLLFDALNACLDDACAVGDDGKVLPSLLRRSSQRIDDAGAGLVADILSGGGGLFHLPGFRRFTEAVRLGHTQPDPFLIPVASGTRIGPGLSELLTRRLGLRFSREDLEIALVNHLRLEGIGIEKLRGFAATPLMFSEVCDRERKALDGHARVEWPKQVDHDRLERHGRAKFVASRLFDFLVERFAGLSDHDGGLGLARLTEWANSTTSLTKG